MKTIHNTKIMTSRGVISARVQNNSFIVSFPTLPIWDRLKDSERKEIETKYIILSL